jgi:anaerobic magnesium-protoporphyrin IX monomethyl ester cyclase
MNKLERRDQPVITIINVPPTADNQPNGEPLRDVYSAAKIPAVGPAVINAVLLKKGYQNVTTIDPRFNSDGKFSDSELERLHNSDIVAATSMSRNRNATLNLFKEIKKYDPNIVTIAGGFSPSFEHEKWLKEEETDFVVVKEGPVSIIQLLEFIQDDKSFEAINGLAYKKDGSIIKTTDRPLLTEAELANIPIPFFSESILRRATTHAVIGGHGCFGNCEYCAVRAMHEGKFRKEPDEKIIKQIQRAPSDKKIFFVDDNFAPLGRIREAKDTMRSIIASGLNNRNYLVQLDTVSVNRDPEVMRLLVKMGVIGVFLGIESMDPDVLKGMRKPATTKQNEDAIKKFVSNGMYIHAMTIAGSEKDTYESIEATNRWLMKLGVNSMQIFAQIPIAGSELAKRKAVLPRVLSDSSRLDGQNVVAFPPEDMTCLGLQNKIYEEYDRFYSPSRDMAAVLKPFLRSLPMHPTRAVKVAALTYLARKYGQRTIPTVRDSEYTREWRNYLEEVDREVVIEGRKKFAEKGVVFDSKVRA